jgi:hypothetical protein
MNKKRPHPPVGHLLPFFEREKATIIKCLRPCREAWEKVAEGRMRALMKETTPC